MVILNYGDDIMSMKNSLIVDKLKSSYPQLTSLMIVDENLVLNEKSINLENFDLEEFLRRNEVISYSLDSINANDFFNIVQLHAMSIKLGAMEGEKEEGKNSKTEIIDIQKFYELLNKSEEWNDEERAMAQKYYEYFDNLMAYEDYLIPEVQDVLTRYRVYLVEIQTRSDDSFQPNIHQLEACNKWNEFESQKEEVNSESYGKPKQLNLIYNNNSSESNGSGGFISTLQLILTIMGWAIIIAGVTILLLT